MVAFGRLLGLSEARGSSPPPSACRSRSRSPRRGQEQQPQCGAPSAGERGCHNKEHSLPEVEYCAAALQRLREEGYREDVEQRALSRGYPIGPDRAAYLDFAGAAPLGQRHTASAEEALRELPPGNPHTSEAVRELQDSVRQAVLQYFNAPADRYYVVFAANATAAMRIVDEAFPYESGSIFAYDVESHTSALGMRRRARACGARVGFFDDGDLEKLQASAGPLRMTDGGGAASCSVSPNLLVMNAESNFSGRCLDLRHLDGLRRGTCRWRVLLDAAKRAASEPLDLGAFQADFVTVSFYKIFGRPTGLGALLIHREAVDLLLAGSEREDSYFGGGTVAAALARSDFAVAARDIVERFSYGTPNFLAIAELPAAFAELPLLFTEGGHAAASHHALALAREAARRMRQLSHVGKRTSPSEPAVAEGARPLCQLYGSWAQSDEPGLQGPTIAFNLLDSKGEFYPFGHVEKIAKKQGIILRVGTMCNYGACEKYLGLTREMVQKSLDKGHSCKYPVDIVDGKPTGAVRVSFGPTSSLRDVCRLLAFLEKFLNDTVLMSVLRARYEEGGFDEQN